MKRNGTSLTGHVLKALGIFGSVEGLNMICSVVRTKLMAIWVGAAGVGMIALFNSTLNLMRTLTMFNLRQGAVREVAAAPEEERAAAAYATGRLATLLGIGGMVIVACLSPLLSMAAFDTYDYTWAFAALSLTMLPSAMCEGRQAVLQATNKLSDLAKASFYGALSATAISLPLVYFFRLNAIVPMLIITSVMILFFMYRPNIDRPAVRPLPDYVKGRIKSLVKLGTYLTVALLAGMGAEYALRIYLSQESSVATVGQFQAGYVLINSYVGVIFSAISMEFYPRLSSVIERRHLVSVIVRHEIATISWILMPVVVLFICADELIVRILYSDDFLPILPFLSFAILAMFLKAVSWCYSYVILAKGDGKVYVFTETLSAVSLVAFSYIGWHYYGFAGLGCAYLAQFIVFTIATWAVCRFRYHIITGSSTWLLILTGIGIGVITLLAKNAVGWWFAGLITIPWLIPLTLKKLRR